MELATETARLLSAGDVQKILGVSRKTLYMLTAPRGTLRSVAIGRHVRYRPETLMAWITEQENAEAATA